MNSTLSSYKFSSAPAVPSVAPDILNGRTPEQFLKEKYSNCVSFGLTELIGNGGYKIHGWRYDFTPYLKLYWAKDIHGTIHECYAPNKTLLRSGFGFTLAKIIEIKD